MSKDVSKTFPCDLCGSHEAEDLAVLRHYNNDQGISVCKHCGFVYVPQRRSPEAIARTWSEEIFKGGGGLSYTARIPLVKARQTYVVETLDTEIGLKGKSLCDIGGGEGQFLEMARTYGADVFAVEPSSDNCKAMKANGIDNFCGTVEEFVASGNNRKFDIVTIMWTLENCQDCRQMLNAAYDALKPGGHLMIATGSRILVPFKKTLHDYISKNPADTHCFRFTANTLGGLMAVTGIKPVFTNRYLDTDWLIVIGQKTDRSAKIEWQGDDWRKVKDFFERWDKETRDHYS